MARTWEKEKAYREKRWERLRPELEQAMEDLDKDRFRKIYTTAANYTTHKVLAPYWKAFIRKLAERRYRR